MDSDHCMSDKPVDQMQFGRVYVDRVVHIVIAFGPHTKEQLGALPGDNVNVVFVYL